MPYPSCICNLHHSSSKPWILNPQREARDWSHNFKGTSRVCYCWATVGPPALPFWLPVFNPFSFSLCICIHGMSLNNVFINRLMLLLWQCKRPLSSHLFLTTHHQDNDAWLIARAEERTKYIMTSCGKWLNYWFNYEIIMGLNTFVIGFLFSVGIKIPLSRVREEKKNDLRNKKQR